MAEPEDELDLDGGNQGEDLRIIIALMLQKEILKKKKKSPKVKT